MKKRQLFRLLAIVLLFALAVISARLAERNARLEAALADARTEVAGLRERLSSAPPPAGGQELLSPPERRRLQDRLGEHAIAALRNDLMTHPELIPVEPSLGGKMGFYDPAQIRILSDRWVMAGFEDGHNAGKLLLRYRIDDGEIRWEVLDVQPL